MHYHHLRSVSTNNSKTHKKTGSWRIWSVFGFLVVCFLFVLARLYSLQVSAYDTYNTLATNQHTVFKELIAKRGEIFLRDAQGQYPLAVNRTYPMVYTAPREVKDREQAINFLVEVTGISREEVERHFENMQDPFEVVAKRVSDEIGTRVKEAKMPGVYVSDEVARFYPSGKLASQIVGFVGADEKGVSGKYGIEASWNELLTGKNGSIEQGSDPIGRWIPSVEKSFMPASDGADLFLTIDQSVQYAVERILEQRIEKHRADGGSIVVMDPKTGNILGLANFPNFDPNAYGKTEDISSFMNNAVSLPYESGSVFKPFTMAIGLDTGKVTPSTTYTDTGEVQISGYSIKNSDEKAHGLQTMKGVLENSLNTGTIFVQRLVGNKDFLLYLKSFGFGDKTGITLPGEAKGTLRNLDDTRRDINFYTASFGQGITVTPIQLATAYSALANGGTLMRPHIVEKIHYADGRVEEIQPEPVRKVIQESTSRSIRDMLLAVVVNGHGKRAAVPGYLVGGKTGTAQVAKSDSKGYHDNYEIGSFVGMAPLEDPRFVVVVKLVDPKDVEWAESSAAPAFQEVMSFLLEYYKVEPTQEYTLGDMRKLAK